MEYTCKIDDLGRVLIPRDLRQSLDWKIGDNLSFRRIDDVIALRIAKADKKSECFICKKPKMKVRINNKDVCASCLEKVMIMMAK